MHTTGSRPRLVVSADGRGVVSHAGSRLSTDPAKITGLTSAFTSALRRLRPRGTGHAPGRAAVDLAVMLADGGETITDPAVLRDQREVFGPVAATPTAWCLLADIGPPALAALREARATARDIAWLQAVDTRDGIPASRAGGRDLPCPVLDLDAPLVTSHSGKEQGAAAYKRGFGYRPLLCFLHHIRALPDRVWHPALEQDGSLRDGAEAAELTGMIDLTGYPDGTRVIVRRERPHPGARLSLFDFDEGMRTWPFSPTPGHGWVNRATPGGPLPRACPRGEAHPPARLDPGPAVGRRVGHRRAQEAPLPAAARRRPHHPRRPPTLPPYLPYLALATRADQRIHPPLSPAPASHLTAALSLPFRDPRNPCPPLDSTSNPNGGSRLRWSRSRTGLSPPRGAHVFEEGRQELTSVVLVRGPCRRRDR